MIEDQQLESWREQWNGIAKPSSEFRGKILRRMKIQDRRFIVGNVLSGIALVGMLVFAVFLRGQSSWLGTGWATGISVLAIVSAAYRLLILRGTWCADGQTTRAFVELWRKRVLARLRLLRISVYVAVGWIVFCGILTAVNWGTIGVDMKARPKEWVQVLVLSIAMQPVIWFWAAWLRRRKMVELEEVERTLSEMNE